MTYDAHQAQSKVNCLNKLVAEELTYATSRVPSETVTVYFPRQEIPDRLSFNRRINVYASGIITGRSAHTDTTRDMWKAPADIKASQGGVLQPIELTILQNIILDWIGINATSLSIKARISQIL